MLNQSNEEITLEMTNLIYQTTAQMANLIFGLKILFWVAGGLFGLFAALMLYNFITVSISSKNKEIGILRAVGARRLDVFKIFIIEALIITLICFGISAILSGFACNVINTYTLENALKITILDYSFINVLLLLGISFIVSLLATIIPVTKAANKSPVDSIRSI
jgi:ABC-type antimicrobial peptide transport system permease subunit